MGAKFPEPGIARNIVKAACPHDCPDTCGMHVSVESGVAVKLEGAKDMPFTQGTLCTKVARYLDRTVHWVARVGLEYVKKHILEDAEGRRALYERLMYAVQGTPDPWAQRTVKGEAQREFEPIII